MFKLEREFDDDMKFGKNLIKMTKYEQPRLWTDRRTDGQAQNNRDNVLFASLLIGLSVDFLRWWHVHVRVVCAHVCACVRVCVRLCVCVIVRML